MPSTSPGIKGSQPRPPRPWCSPSLRQWCSCTAPWTIRLASRSMGSRSIIGSSVRLWVLTRPGIRGRPRGKIHRRGPHPLERGVDHVSFEVRRGEIFGLLGPNGAGKTTTFRMLCGLLPATGGTLRVADMDLRKAQASARQRIGYVAQKFSLYGALSVTENLEFFASAYGLRGARKRDRIDWALQQFALAPWPACPVASYQADTSSGWRWRQRSCTSRRSSSWMSRPVVLTRSPAGNSGGALRCWLSRA